MFEAWDELSSYKIRSSVGAGARGPFKSRGEKGRRGGAILDGAEAGFAVGATEPAGDRDADTDAGCTKG